MPKQSKAKLNLYLHIPFCERKCNYCSFYSLAGNFQRMPDYFQAMQKEIQSYAVKLTKYQIDTIYIGGGTPSFVPANLITELINFCKQNFNLSAKTEITLEANPESIDSEKLDKYIQTGINRISIGLQACQDKILNNLGRNYTITQFKQSLASVIKAGFENINLDLIFGIPGQAFREWQESIAQVLTYKIQHLACYSLELDNNSLWGNLYRLHKLKPAPESLDRQMYWYAVQELTKSEFEHYEISNFAKKRKHALHNLNFWQGEPYIGIGAAAHSYFQGQRYNNVYNLEQYCQKTLHLQSTRENYEKINQERTRQEFLLLRLRLRQGVSLAEFQQQFKQDLFVVYGPAIKKLIKQGFLQEKQEHIRLSNKGLDFNNQVIQELLT